MKEVIELVHKDIKQLLKTQVSKTQSVGLFPLIFFFPQFSGKGFESGVCLFVNVFVNI